MASSLLEVSGLPLLEAGFTGRESLQHEIRQRVERDGQRLIVLQGADGVGKTALASQLLSRVFAPDRRDQLVLRGCGLESEADPGASLRSQAEEHGRVLQLPRWEERLKRLREEIPESTPGFAATIAELRQARPGLVLYVDDAGALQDEGWAGMEKLAAQGLVLVSTRDDCQGLAPAARVPVDPMSPADVLALLDVLPSFAPLSPEGRERLASRVDGHPRTLEVLDRLIQERPPEQVIEPLLLEHTGKLHAGLLLEELWNQLTPAAREHAVRTGVLRVPAPRFVVDRLGHAANTAGELIRTGLLTWFREQVLAKDGARWMDRWGLHSLVRSFLASKSEEEARRKAHVAAGEAYAEWAKQPGARWFEQEEGIHHFHAAGEGDRAWPMVREHALRLRRRSRHREALRLVESCAAAGATGDQLALASVLQAQMRRELGDRSPGLVGVLESALEVASSDPTRGVVLHEHGSLRIGRGEYAEAETLLRRSVELKQAALGESHPSLCATLTNLAIVLAEQGRAKEGEPFLREALDVALQAHGPSHPEVADVLTNLADLQALLGRREAPETARRALAALAAAFGADHPVTRQVTPKLQAIAAGGGKSDPVSKLLSQAQAAARQGNFATAIAAQQEAVELMRTARKEREVLIALSVQLFNLAGYQREAGRYEDAVQTLEKVVEFDERTGHSDLESDRQALEEARRMAALAPAEREAFEQAQGVAAQIRSLADQARDGALAALRGETERDPLITTIEEVAAKSAEGEADGSPWSNLSLYLRAVVALLRGEPAREVPAAFAEHLAAIQAARKGGGLETGA
jgi:tetratricopeptide (TPR) repeat protein